MILINLNEQKKRGLLPKGKHGVKHMFSVCAWGMGADRDTVCSIRRARGKRNSALKAVISLINNTVRCSKNCIGRSLNVHQ